MNEMKYIVFEIGNWIPEFAIVFPSYIKHDTFKNIGKPIGAGFVSKNEDGSHYVHGWSESLKVNSRPQDKKLIQELLDK